MTRIIFALVLSIFAASCAFAGGLEVLTLVETQGQSDIGLLVGASDSLKAEYFPDGKMPSQILAFWVMAGDNGILFDAGLRAGNIPAELSTKGIDTENVKTILLTHLHGDHFGGLVNAEGRATFPNAEVYVSKPEYDYWVNELKNDAVISALKLYRVKCFAFGDEVVPGVRAIDTAGHTPGHVSFLVEYDGGKIIIAGDIMHFQTIQLPHPEVTVKYDVDPVKAVQSRKFLLDYAAWKKIPVAGMHIMLPGIISVTKSGDGYEKQ
ncbi:MAG: MBL fold metallo-hydrolase [Synergistaceae bacterium]|nr:MBL fold metallo-hydrolase [Synergistaceae bacterium]